MTKYDARIRAASRAPLAGRHRGHERAAAGVLPAAAPKLRRQPRDISSARPFWYAASRDALSASS
jgi:hypothetical protein